MLTATLLCTGWRLITPKWGLPLVILSMIEVCLEMTALLSLLVR
jgi:hypothetical protein